jgi:hypothetical protein
VIPTDPEAARARFRQVVARGLERAASEAREHSATIRPERRTREQIRDAQTPTVRPKRMTTRRP